MSQYSETIGSFTRTGNYPLEANYIFESEEALKQFYTDPIQATTLHEGLLKIVKSSDKQSLYWVVDNEGSLEFTELISNLDLGNIEGDLSSLQSKLEQEITDRKNADAAIMGGDLEDFPEGLNNLLNIANSLKDLIAHVDDIYEEETNANKALKEELQATVGTEEEDIKAYLQTLDYRSLTSLSEALNNFLNKTDGANTSINTWPELQSFLAGYTDTEVLKTVLENLVNNLLGNPTPTESFRTLRGVEDFVRELKAQSESSDKNLQTELDQTQVGVGLSSDGSYSADQETHYLKEATSVMNALKTLDSLIYDTVQEFVISPVNKDVVPLEITKTDNGYTIGASLSLSNVQGNQLIKKADGLYYNTKLNYDDGLITLTINDAIISQFNIGITSILNDGYYNPENEELVLVFNKEDGSQQTARIPVGTLIREWEVDNSQTNKVVELNREEVIDGTDKLSADVRISEKAHNILTKDGNSLFVEGTSDAITYNEQSLTSVILDLQNKVNTNTENIDTEKTERKEVDSTLSNLITTNTNDITSVKEELKTKAPIDSPIFTGVPQVNTSPDAGDQSNRIPSTSWVIERIKESYPVNPGSFWLILENE